MKVDIVALMHRMFLERLYCLQSAVGSLILNNVQQFTKFET
jgi:hypothetical protein